VVQKATCKACPPAQVDDLVQAMGTSASPRTKSAGCVRRRLAASVGHASTCSVGRSAAPQVAQARGLPGARRRQTVLAYPGSAPGPSSNLRRQSFSGGRLGSRILNGASSFNLRLIFNLNKISGAQSDQSSLDGSPPSPYAGGVFSGGGVSARGSSRVDLVVVGYNLHHFVVNLLVAISKLQSSQIVVIEFHRPCGQPCPHFREVGGDQWQSQ
jgi:hypothetical protein